MPRIHNPWIRSLLGTLITVAVLIALPLAVGSLVNSVELPGPIGTWLEGVLTLLRAFLVLVIVGGLIGIGCLVGDWLFG